MHETSCQACQDRSTSLEGSLTDADCFCTISYTGPNGGSIPCAACAMGKFKPSLGSAACIQCAGGKYLDFEAATANVCVDCSVQTHSSADRSQCVTCPSNSNSPTASSAETSCRCNVGYSGNTLHAAPHCTTLHHTASHCTILHHTAPHCTIQQHPETPVVAPAAKQLC